MEVVTRNVHGYLMEVQLPPALTDQERLEWLHKRWKDKQDAVPDDDEDVFILRDDLGVEVKLERSRLHNGNTRLIPFVVNEVKLSLGEAEKGAK